MLLKWKWWVETSIWYRFKGRNLVLKFSKQICFKTVESLEVKPVLLWCHALDTFFSYICISWFGNVAQVPSWVPKWGCFYVLLHKLVVDTCWTTNKWTYNLKALCTTKNSWSLSSHCFSAYLPLLSYYWFSFR